MKELKFVRSMYEIFIGRPASKQASSLRQGEIFFQSEPASFLTIICPYLSSYSLMLHLISRFVFVSSLFTLI